MGDFAVWKNIRFIQIARFRTGSGPRRIRLPYADSFTRSEKATMRLQTIHR